VKFWQCIRGEGGYDISIGLAIAKAKASEEKVGSIGWALLGPTLPLENCTAGEIIPSVSTPRRVGIEIEVEGGRWLSNPPVWGDLKDDASLGPDGAEYVSAPLTEKDTSRWIGRMCRVISSLGARVNEDCGLHVHVEITDEHDKDGWRNLYRLYHHLEESLYVLSGNRTDNKYCRPWNGWAKEAMRQLIVQEYDPRDIIPEGRYYGLNLMAFDRHHTVEFRMHKGSIDEKEILRWTTLCRSVVEYAFSREAGWNPIYGPLQTLLDIYPEEKEWLEGMLSQVLETPVWVEPELELEEMYPIEIYYDSTKLTYLEILDRRERARDIQYDLPTWARPCPPRYLTWW